MPERLHRYSLHLRWTGAGAGGAAQARSLHAAAASMCFIRRSMAFPVLHEATLRIA
jgi:organic hydroperoxide reductase OsmC/OhrA